jgi:flagellin-like hook-associated protein FlgL
MSDVTLSAAVRNNLLALQNTANMMATTQERLATGKKVNSALDNPTNFFTASSLDSRANDLTSLLDGVSNGVQTLQAADSGITGITSLVNQLQATARQALQASASYSSKASISTGTITGMTASDLLGGATGTGGNAVLTATGTAITAPVAAGHAVATAANAITAPVQASNAVATGTSALAAIDASGGDITFKVSGTTVTLSQTGGTGGTPGTGHYTAQDVVDAINNTVGITAQATLNGAGDLVLTSTGTAGASDTVTVDTFSSGDATQLGFAGATVSTSGADASGGVDASGGAITFNVNSQTVTLAANGGTNADGHWSGSDIAAAINSQVGTSAKVNATVNGAGDLVLTSTNTAGASDAVAVDTFSTGDATSLGFASASESASGTGASGGIDATVAGGVSFEVNGQTVTLSSSGGTNSDGHYSAADIASAINTAVGTSAKVNATVNGSNELVLTSTGTAGSADAVTLGGFVGTTASGLGFATTSANGSDTYSGGATNGLAGTTLILTGTDGITQKTITFGAEAGGVHTLDDLNSALSSLNLQATLTDNQLTITTTTSAGAEAFTVDASSTSVGSGKAFASSTVSAAVMGGDGEGARSNFVTQYNSLLSQIDSLAQDSSYNGVNLLNNDDLTITMNETGSSKLDIKGVNDSSTGLGLSQIANLDFADSDSINKVLSTLNNAVSTLRSQSSQFGSNLSVVQTRQDFTKSLVNVLQTGSSNLTTADSNEEGANLLALQTRQSLSTTALSMASQADQNVLRLFQ